MGIRLPRRSAVERAGDHRRRTPVRRQPGRRRVFAERGDRLHPLVLQAAGAACDRRSASRRVRRKDAARFSATRPATSTRSTRRPARSLWKTRVDDMPIARISGSPTFHNGRLYVPAASGEEGAGSLPTYECCRFRGSVSRVRAGDGQARLEDVHDRRRTKADEEERGRHAALGTVGRAACGRVPAIDTRRNALYVTTGNNYSDPPRDTSDAFMALDLDTGQDPVAPADDAERCLHLGVPAAGQDQLPERRTDLTSTSARRRFSSTCRTASARSSPARNPASSTPLDPDNSGAILWQTRVGQGGTMGGVQWGSAADAQNVYVANLGHRPHHAHLHPRSPMRTRKRGGGMYRAEPRDGREGLVHAAVRLRHAAALQPGAVGRGVGAFPASRSRDRSTATCAPIRRRRQGRVGLRHRTAVRDGQRRRSARRLD